MNTKEFINQVFIAEYSQIVSKHAYISFALIGLGIEFLGACLDPYEFSETALSEARVKNAILSLLPTKYQAYQGEISKDLRNGFAHQFRPGMRLELSQRSEAHGRGWQHLEKTPDQKLCLVAEDLYDDFADACRAVIGKIDNGDLNHPKLAKTYLRV
jgi:hypothetical protein